MGHVRHLDGIRTRNWNNSKLQKQENAQKRSFFRNVCQLTSENAGRWKRSGALKIRTAKRIFSHEWDIRKTNNFSWLLFWCSLSRRWSSLGNWKNLLNYFASSIVENRPRHQANKQEEKEQEDISAFPPPPACSSSSSLLFFAVIMPSRPPSVSQDM